MKNKNNQTAADSRKTAACPKTAFKLGVCQLMVVNDKKANLDKARTMIEESSAKGCRLVVLPEMFNCPYEKELFPAYAETYPGGESIRMLSRAARENGVLLVGGSIPERDGSAVYNTSFIFNQKGELIGRHRKIHLFDVDLPGGVSFRESETLTRGDNLTVVDTELCKVGVAVCYDIRFPELMRLMALEGARIIIIPGAFNLVSGPAHWELSLRMRAVDNQVFTVGASPARNDQSSYRAWGHSMVVDPWGDILAEAGTGEEIICADIDLERVNTVRNQLPLMKHRRVDLYELRQKR